MIEIVFWSAVALVAYAYAGFPLLLAVRSRLCALPHRESEIAPAVSLIICAYNEASVIGRKLQNVLAMDYPAERLEVIVASDGSDDGTERIVEGCGDPRVRLLSLPRQGKIAALNTAVGQARGEILAFSDANSMFAPDALRCLVRPFADPAVGGVAGDQRYFGARGGQGERAYWSVDRAWKRWQSRAGSVTSATGAIYAIRANLFRPIPAGVTDDFVNSAGVIAHGYRLVFAPDAAAYEEPVASHGAEFRRKVRLITRGLRGVMAMRGLLNPFAYGFYSLQLFTHKVLRRLVVVPLLVLAVLTPLLWQESSLYRALLVGQIALYGAAACGAVLEATRAGRFRALSLPYYFCVVNAAALLAAVNAARGRTIDLWQPPRHEIGQQGLEAAPRTAALSGSQS